MSAITQEALSRLLGDDFTDLRPLGESGGLSRLFRAHKISLDVDVVIKRMRMDPRSDARREARILTSLRHQYLPRVYGFETDREGYCYTIMELIPGCTLRQYVARHGALDQKQTLRWLQQLALAADQPKDYMPQMRLALLYARQESEKSAGARDYQKVLEHYDRAEELYTETGVPDSEMLQLRELVYQIRK